MSEADGSDMDDETAAQLQMMKQLMEQQQSDGTHARSASWGSDVNDVMKRNLNGIGIPDEADISNVNLIEEAEEEAIEELQDIHAEKELIEKAFAKIDVDNNEDIESDEFVNGLKKLKVKLNIKDMQKVFNLMDFDKSNYIDRNEFAMFLTQRYESKQLSRMQMAILDAIRNQNGGHNRKPSGMELRDQTKNDVKNKCIYINIISIYVYSLSY